MVGVAVTISRGQAEYARQLCGHLPVEIQMQDYRKLNERFDAAFSIGIFEPRRVRRLPVTALSHRDRKKLATEYGNRSPWLRIDADQPEFWLMRRCFCVY